MATNWSSDVPISMPEALKSSNPGLVPMFGFTFTENGLAHDLSQGDLEELALPAWAPASNPNGKIVRGDSDFRYDVLRP